MICKSCNTKVPGDASNGAQKAVVKYWNDIKDGDYGSAYDLYRHGRNRVRGTDVVRRAPGAGWRIDDQDLTKTSC